MLTGGDESMTKEVCSKLHRGWGKVKIAMTRWVPGDAVLLTIKEVAACIDFVAWPG
jgi:hypothetical protein